MARTKSKESTAANRNREKLSQDESYMEIPEMKDIPGQEHIHNAGVPGEMADTTISSDDEEGVVDGKDLLGEEEEGVEDRSNSAFIRIRASKVIWGNRTGGGLSYRSAGGYGL